MAPRGPDPKGLATASHVDDGGGYEKRAALKLVAAGTGEQLSPERPWTRLVIGSSEVADVRVDDKTVSRMHCEIALDGTLLRIRDLGSRNGTFVDGVRVKDAYLRDGALIQVGRRELRLEVGPTQRVVPLAAGDRYESLIGRSLAMRRIYAQLQQVAATDSTVLVLGETGTGKELVADSLRSASGRAEGPFVVVDCGATPAALLESELFGHEKGAFTSAASTRIGAFEAAHTGTLFLDEIGELPLELQPKLLRVLDKREIKRVGRSDYRPVDVRVIAATNRDLLEEIDRKAFRSDLYYRLAVVEVRLPPLRERLEDLPLLVEHFLGGLRGDEATKQRIAGPESLARMARHGWPGNVRELKNHVERSLVAGGAGLPEPVSAPPGAGEASPLPAITAQRQFHALRADLIARFEHAYASALLAAHQGNVRAAAAAAGLDRAYLYRLLWKHGLR